MAAEGWSRRRVITVLAGSAAGFLVDPAAVRAGRFWEWRGFAMGADARILLCDPDEDRAREATALAVAEIERLEKALSLFRDESEICRLNRAGFLRGPSADLRRALALALAVAEPTDGSFDPTVQALWEAHVDWFAANPGAGLPPERAIAGARASVDWRKLSLAADSITLACGQRITLNGLGQGYVTDRIADLLRGRGFAHVLVDLGEQRALGPRQDGGPWLVRRQGIGEIALYEGGLATSEGAGCVLGAQGAAHHLFDPRTGRSAADWRIVTVHHPSAAAADVLSTALYAARRAEIETMLTRFAGITVWATDRDGREWRWQTAGGNYAVWSNSL
jgi:thiamine biosynthesis lipoprotein